jgi:hypothetical protein
MEAAICLTNWRLGFTTRELVGAATEAAAKRADNRKKQGSRAMVVAFPQPVGIWMTCGSKGSSSLVRASGQNLVSKAAKASRWSSHSAVITAVMLQEGVMKTTVKKVGESHDFRFIKRG